MGAQQEFEDQGEVAVPACMDVCVYMIVSVCVDRVPRGCVCVCECVCVPVCVCV